MSTDLTRTPDAEDFRALARSAPWRFRTLHWTHRAQDGGSSARDEPAQAWLDREEPRLTVRQGREVFTHTEVPYGTALNMVWEPGEERPSGPPPPYVPPGRDEGVTFREDGLVSARPQGWAWDHSDPMWGDYRWTAMLDPAELADGMSPGEDDGPAVQVDGVDVTDVTEVELRGRRTWQAVCRPLVDAYDPRCGCCPLLDSVASRLVEYGPDDPTLATSRESLPAAYLVSLDVRTGVVVDVSPQDGDGAGCSFGNEIHAVDEPLRPPAAR
ncbi:hypothetical protein SGUI_1202 [Serinicoccus hydrothermalis]|uniref:Uncharacterized protein n=1 Tax=Serinicoccus hydrothermalis TaxID=1758689 RepID=A0A1B1NAY8_9MICO|nr:hypothetical protein [Serinicoccus hydrothermalis]ANS78598.1 hypothetical protein SGUI_1202 [Serinicoccus hydrothermalis]